MSKKFIAIGITAILCVFAALLILINNFKVTPEALETETLKFNKLNTQNNYKQALKAIDNVIKMNKKLYGKTSYETGKTYLKKAEFLINKGIYDEAKRSIDEAVKISEDDSVSPQLKNDIFYTLYNYYFAVKMYDENLKLIDSSDKDSIFAFEKANEENFYGIIYLSTKNDSMAEKHFNNFKNVLKDKKQLLQYYQNMMYTSQDISNYKLYKYYLEKSEEITNKYLPYDTAQKMRNLMARVSYYIECSNYEEALKLLNENFEKYTQNKNTNKLEFYTKYFDIYKEMNNKEKTEEYLKEIEKIQTIYPKNSLLNIEIIGKIIDWYKWTDDKDKVYEETEKALKLTESVKEYAPALYAQELKNAAVTKKDFGDMEESYKLINEALEIYLQIFPENSYPVYEVYKDYADILSADGKNDEALENYQKALEIVNGLKGVNTLDSANIYESMANIYSAQENKKTALEYITKATDIYSKAYGKDNVKTYEKMITKCNIYNNFSMNKEAEKLMNYMKNNITKKRAEGYSQNVYEQLNIN